MTSILLKCCIFALITGVLALLLREIPGGQWSFYCVLVSGIMLFISGLSMFEEFYLQIRSLIEKSGLQSTEFGVLLKGTILCICGDFTGEFCKSTGQPLLAHGIELIGRICLGILAIPFILEMLSMVEGILHA